MLFNIYFRKKANKEDPPGIVWQGPFEEKKADKICADMAAIHREYDYWKEAI